MSGFKVGDRVRLKSGGPVMTICELSSSGKWFCIWFELNYSAKPFDSYFYADVLQKVEDSDVDSVREKLGTGADIAN